MPVQTLTTPPRRSRILGEEELKARYGLPRFTEDERRAYFSLTLPEKAALGHLRSVKSGLSFRLQLGSFKSPPLFFVFPLADVMEDARFSQEQYFPNTALTDLDITTVTRLKHHRVILALFHSRHCGTSQRRALAGKARQAATISATPLSVFRALLPYLREYRLIAPGYTAMQDSVGQALT